MVGVGARPGVAPYDIVDAVRMTVGDRVFHGLATVDRRADEPAVIAAAAELGVPLLGFAVVELGQVEVPNPAERTVTALGTASVAEAAAVLACHRFGGTGTLVVPKTVIGAVTVAVAVVR